MLVTYTTETQDYIVEFGNSYVRFYKDHEPVKKSDGTIYQLVTPYIGEDVDDIKTIQNGDYLYIFSRKHPVKMLARYSDDDWRLTDFDISAGPFDNVNTTDNGLKVSDVSGIVTITADSELFTANDVGRLIRITVVNSNKKAWYSGMDIKTNEVVSSDGKYYEAQSDGKTGNVKPVHTVGIQSDGTVSFKYIHAGYGLAKITEYISPTIVKARVINRFPDELKSSTSTYWELGLLHKGREYPHCGTFYRNRFCFIVDVDNIPHVCMSCSDDYNNFSDKEHGEVLATNSIIVKVISNQRNIGKWIFASDVLFVGTSSGEFYIDSATQSEPMSPDNVKIQRISEVGCCSILPQSIGSHVIFTTATKTSIRDIVYSFTNDAYDPVDLSLNGKHLLASGITSMTYQEYPDKILWFTTNDGKLIGLTFSSEEKVAAFHQHDLNGNVLNVTSAKYNNTEELWVEVERDNSVCIEWIGDGYPSDCFDEDKLKKHSFFVDCGKEIEIPRITQYNGYFYESTKNLLNKEIKVVLNDEEATYRPDEDVYLLIYGSSEQNDGYLGRIEWSVNTNEDDMTYTFKVDKQFLGSEILVRLYSGGEGFYQDIQHIILEDTEFTIHTETKVGEARFVVGIYGGHNAANNTLDGLNHLEGKEVAIMEDGAEVERKIVKDGKILIRGKTKRVAVGLPIKSVYIPQTIYISGNNGSGVGDVQRIDHVTLMLLNSLGGKIGKDIDNLDDILYRDSFELMDDSAPLYTGNKQIPVSLNTSTIKEKGATIVIYNDSVFPMNILAIAPHLTTSGNGL